MNRRKLGRIDLQVSELCLGTLNFGWDLDEATALDILDRFHAAGGNFIQTRAVGAGGTLGADASGVSETYVGRWLKSRGIARDGVVLASRLAVASPNMRGDPFKMAASIRPSCEESLRRLNVRYLDLLVLEWSDDLSMDEALIAAETLVRAGMIRHVVASGFPVWRVMEWIGHSSRRNLCRLEAMQHEFSVVANAGVNAEAFALCRARRLGFIARSPLAGGLLAARDSAGFAPTRRQRELVHSRDEHPTATAALAEVRAIAEAQACSPASVALAWVLAHPGVSSALVDVHSPAQHDELLAGATLDLSFSDKRRLERRWRSPGERTPDDEFNGLRDEAAPYLPCPSALASPIIENINV